MICFGTSAKTSVNIRDRVKDLKQMTDNKSDFNKLKSKRVWFRSKANQG